jgi:phosphate:Na+ symporter
MSLMSVDTTMQTIRSISRPDRVLCLLLVSTLALLASNVFAAEGQQDIAVGQMTMELLGGLALFLFGMEEMTRALKAVAGDRMKTILARLTTNRWMGAMTGAFVTAVIQSSSVTTVLVVGFVTAGLMSLSQSIGVIMGANIGTTITAQIVAFKVTKAALLMIAVGFGMSFVSKQERVKHYGTMLMGLGLVFFGMSVMSSAMAPLRSYEPFLDLMMQMENPIVGILIAAAFTGLIQSSSASTAIVIVMASQGFITLPAGIALAFGSNIGTCVTAMLAAIGKPREAVRAATVHVLFNVAGVMLWFGLIDPLAEVVTAISPSHPELAGTDRLAAETPRQIANAHTIFNIANTFIFIWFSVQIGRLVEILVPDRPLELEPALIEPKYLDDALLETPSLALDRTRLEFLHMGEHVQAMLKDVLPAIVRGDNEALTGVADHDDQVDILHARTVEYLASISKLELTDSQNDEFIRLISAVNDMENIGDIIETNLVVLGEKLKADNITISEPTQKVLAGLHQTVIRAVDGAILAVSQNNERSALAVIDMKDEITRQSDAAALHEVNRLVAAEPNRIPAYTIEMDIIEKLKRVYYFAKRIAKTVTPEEEELKQVHAAAE